jgi:hypothetical protein
VPNLSKMSLPFRFPDKNFVYIISPMRPLFNYPNYVSWRLQIMKLLILQFSQVSCYFLHLRSNFCILDLNKP